MKSTSLFLLYGSVTSALVPIIVYMINRRTIKHRAIIFLVAASIVAFASDTGSLILADIGDSSIPLINLYWLITFILLTLYFNDLLGRKGKYLFGALAIVVAVFILNTVLWQGAGQYQGFSVAAGGMMLMIFSLTYFSSILERLPSENIMHFAFFWTNSAIGFYFSFNFLLFVFANYVFTSLSPEEGIVFWTFHNINNIIKNLLFAVGIYYAGKTTSPAQ